MAYREDGNAEKNEKIQGRLWLMWGLEGDGWHRRKKVLGNGIYQDKAKKNSA